MANARKGKVTLQIENTGARIVMIQARFGPEAHEVLTITAPPGVASFTYDPADKLDALKLEAVRKELASKTGPHADLVKANKFKVQEVDLSAKVAEAEKEAKAKADAEAKAAKAEAPATEAKK